MSGIFISYRREDSAGWTGRLAEALKQQFGPESVFMDIDTVKPGTDFTEALQQAVSSCEILLAIIGPEWATATNKSGRLRLEDPDDWVRVEIAAALKRKIRVIPVLVGGASVPTMDLLPDELDPLAHRQMHELTDKRWNYDVQQLVNTFPPSLRRLRLFSNMQLWRSTPVMIGALVIALTLTVWMFTSIYSPRPIQENTADTTPSGTPNADPPQETSAKAEQSAAPQPSHFRAGQEARLKDHVTFLCV